jgi:hypothetical protein
MGPKSPEQDGFHVRATSANRMDIEDALAIWSPARLAEILGTSTQNICVWIKRGVVPLSREYELQVKSGGRLTASTFNPDVDYVTGGLRDMREKTWRVK